MRLALVRSLSLAVSLAAGHAYAQDVRTAPTPPRGATLGLPVAVEPAVDSRLTPASMVGPGPDVGAFPPGMGLPGTYPTQFQLPQPAPLAPSVPQVPQVPPLPLQSGLPAGAFAAPTGTLPLLPAPPLASNTPFTGTPAPGVTQLPPPTPLPPAPSVTESRTPGLPGTVPPMPVPQYPGGLPYEAPLVPPGGEFPPYGIEPCPPDCGLPTGRGCCPNPWYTGAEFLMWWTRSMQTPPLLTTSPPSSSGMLGSPGTHVLYGGDVGDTFHGGARFTLGRWFGDDCQWGVEGRFFFLGYDPSTYVASSSQYPVLARPFYNANTPAGPFSELISYPGLASGIASITTTTQLWGAEANLRRVLFGNPNSGFELDAIVGYRYLELDEHLSFTEDFKRTPGSNMAIGTPAVAGSVYDSFHTTDVFHGGQIGLNASYERGPWSVESRVLVGFGDLQQTAYIGGNQTLYYANGSVGHYAGGLLALPGANLGTFHRDQFAVLPEVMLNLGYQITSHCRVFVGYDFLFLGNALRPGGAIDTTIDAARIPNFPLPGSPAPLPGAPRPGPYFQTSDFFAQGVNFGLEFRW